MKIKKRGIIYPKYCSHPKRKENELPVYGNQVVTPAEMNRLREKGIPITAQNIHLTAKDGEQNPSFELPLDRIKGVDPAEMWERSQIIKERARTAHNTDIKRFGMGKLKDKNGKDVE